MLEGVPTMDDIDFRGKTTLVRVDLNLPYNKETNKYGHSPRMAEHAKTIKELANRGAKVVILAHQGRPGSTDFLHLEKHAQDLGHYIGKAVKYVDDIMGSTAKAAIRELQDGDILLLENVRFLAEERMDHTTTKHSDSLLVRSLAPLCDIYVLDAYSAAHRGHVSMVGFPAVLPSAIGRVMEQEIKAIRDAIDNPKSPSILVVGGAKPEECISAMKHLLETKNVDKVLTTGVIGNLMLMVRGYKFGEATTAFFKNHQFFEMIPVLKEMDKKYDGTIETPIDLAIEVNGKREEIEIEKLPVDNEVLDIGTKTAKHYAIMIKKAATINIKGPAGVYEHPQFEKGTRAIIEAIAESEGFSVIGGGHTLSSIHKLGIDRKHFSHVTLGGGAMLHVLCGKKLPALEAVRNSPKTKSI